ncbi:MAG: non-homologous end-joining DNA ligase [Flavisolibacter sp.]
MPQKRTNLKTQPSPSKELIKLPAKKARVDNSLTVNVRQDRKDYSFIVSKIKKELNIKGISKMPVHLKPMLATITAEAFNDKDWQFEIKWDGYRAIVYNEKGTVDIRSRNNLSFNANYPPIYQAFEQWPVNAVIDGEIVVLSEKGSADFNSLQYWKQFQNGILVYYAFDLLWLEGLDLTSQPLSKRREILKKILPDKGVIRYSDDIEEYGIDLFEAVKKSGMEGIIAKKRDSVYTAGQRTKLWYKIKAEKRHEAVICGYTRKADSDRLFSSLILGMYEGKNLVFIGQVGTGWGREVQKEIMDQMKPLFINTSAFEQIPSTNDRTFWIKPKLICEVKYTELTKEGVMRHPSFQGMRIDKKADEVQLNNDIVIPKVRNLKRNKWFKHQ